MDPSATPETKPDPAEFAAQLRNHLHQAYKVARETLSSAHQTQKSYYDKWAKVKAYKKGELVLWFDKKTRRARCMKLNRPWTGPWEVLKQLNDVVYLIRYHGKDKMQVTRRVVHHNQLKPFLGNTETEPWPSRELESHQQPRDATTLELSMIEGDYGGPTTEEEGDYGGPTAEEEELLQGDDDLMDEDPVAGRPQRVRRETARMRDYELGI